MGHDGRGVQEASQGEQEPGPQVDEGKRLTTALGKEEKAGAGANTATPNPQFP